MTNEQRRCKSKTNITFVPFKYRQTCLKMTFDVGKCGSYVIFKLGEYIFGFVWNFSPKFCNFLILHVAQLSVRYLTYQNYFLFILLIVYAWWVTDLKGKSKRNSTHECTRLRNVLLKFLHFFFYNTLKMLLQNIVYLTFWVPKSVVNYNKLKFQLNFNSI